MASIPRQGGRFYWNLVETAVAAGAKSLYVAMFDEVNEGTAVFKVSDAPPVGDGQVRRHGRIAIGPLPFPHGRGGEAAAGRAQADADRRASGQDHGSSEFLVESAA